MRVDVLHNTHPAAPDRGFAPTDPLVHVQRFDVEDSHDQEVLAHVVWLTTVAHRAEATSGRPDEQALAYRHAGHRDLRTGDVVVLDTRVWAAARVGWTLLATTAPAAPAPAAPALPQLAGAVA